MDTLEIEIPEPRYMDPATIARRIMVEAVAKREAALRQEHEEWLLDQEEMKRLGLLRDDSKAEQVRRAWETRKARNKRLWASGAAPDDSPIPNPAQIEAGAL